MPLIIWLPGSSPPELGELHASARQNLKKLIKPKYPRGFLENNQYKSPSKHQLNIGIPSPTPMKSSSREEEPSCKLEPLCLLQIWKVNVSTAVCSRVINVGDLRLLHIWQWQIPAATLVVCCLHSSDLGPTVLNLPQNLTFPLKAG